MEKKSKFFIAQPIAGDEVLIGLMHKQAWLETYLDEEHGITEGVINEEISFVATPDGDLFRKNVFTEAQSHPDKILYRVARNQDGKVVGFIHCTKDDAQNEIEGIYLLNEAKGFGVGSRLMNEFLVWADKTKQCFLKVFTANKSAIRFYKKYGFEISYEPPELIGKKFAFVEMTRPAETRK